jgi:hypothetical protein
MDFEQIKNQFLQKGKQALDAIRNAPKISESIGIPYAKEFNQYVNTGNLQRDVSAGLKGFGETFEAAKPTVLPNLRSGFITEFKPEAQLRKELTDDKLVLENPIFRDRETFIKNIERQLDTGKQELRFGITKDLTPQQRESLSQLLITQRKLQDEQIKQYRRDNEAKLLELQEAQKISKTSKEKITDIIKKNEAENVFSVRGALTQLGGSGPDLIGQYAVPIAGLALNPGGKLKLATYVPRAASLGYTYLSTKGSYYNELINEGVTPEKAELASSIVTPINTAISYFPVGLLTKTPVGDKLVKEALEKNIVKEVAKFSKTLPGNITRQALAEGSE